MQEAAARGPRRRRKLNARRDLGKGIHVARRLRLRRTGAGCQQVGRRRVRARACPLIEREARMAEFMVPDDGAARRVRDRADLSRPAGRWGREVVRGPGRRSGTIARRRSLGPRAWAHSSASSTARESEPT